MKTVQPQFIVPRNNHGFSLTEVMVVMVIVAILATGVVFMFSNPSARVKGQVFTMLGELNQARSEAVNRNVDVRVTFLPGATAADVDGYRIWIDDWHAVNDAEGSDNLYLASASGSDTLVLETYFPLQVQFYDVAATGGPTVKPEGGVLDMNNGDGDDDGVEFDNDEEFIFTSMGIAEDSASSALDNTGYVYLYYPSPGSPTVMRGTAYALVVASGVGSMKISRWDKGASAWKSK